MPTLRQLEYLVTVAETRHFGRAAERVHVTQPTLSEQLRALEDRLGVQLVERSRSTVVVTPIGLEVVEIGRRMLRDAQRIRDLTGSVGHAIGGVIRLGLPSTIGPYLLPRIVPHLHARYPKLKLYVREDLPYALPHGLAEGLHDVIVAPLPIAHHGFREADLFQEPLYLTVPIDHDLAGRDRITSHDLAGLDLLALGPGHQLRDIVVNLAAEVGANLRFDYEGTSLDTLREMMATGLGVSVLPGLYVRSVVLHDPRFRTFTIADRDLKRTIGIFWRNTRGSQANFERLAALFREAVGKPIWMWTIFMAVVFTLLALDLGLFHRKARDIGVVESLLLSGFYIAIALIFGGWIWISLGPTSANEYITGFLIEKTLALDNIFVISLIFTYFSIPNRYQHRVLFWGILGVIVLRGIMIGLGAVLVAEFSWLLYIFAIFLIVTGIKMLMLGDKLPDIENNPALRLMRRLMRITPELERDRFFVRRADPATGAIVTWVTPLFVALVLVRLSIWSSRSTACRRSSPSPPTLISFTRPTSLRSSA